MKPPVPMPSLDRPSEGYRPERDFFDEAFDASGTPRAHYAPLVEALEDVDLDRLKRRISAEVHARDIRFGARAGVVPFAIDPVPRIFPRTEWDELARGLAQRVRALNAFIADVHGSQRILEAGCVPRRLLDGAVHFEPDMRDVPVAGGVYAGVAGLDLVRGADGRMLVLEDNLRTPSGIAYTAAARALTQATLADLPGADPAPLDEMVARLGATLVAAAPEGVDEPCVVVLSDGPVNAAWWEHRTLARELEIPVVRPGELSVRDGRLLAPIEGRQRPVDVVYRRTDEDRLRQRNGELTRIAELLLEPCRRGRLAVVNAFGSGIADDKLAHAYVPEMVRFYLGEKPLLASVTSYDMANREHLDATLQRLDEMVIKPRSGHGGRGVVIMAHASAEERREAVRLVRRHPERFIAQELVHISTHPTVIAGRGLRPRHVDLRPFVLSTPEGEWVAPGGLTRVAFGEGVLVVNSSQDGGGKDTWVTG